MNRHRTTLAAIVALALLCGGCVQRTEQDGALLFSFTWYSSWWIVLAATMLMYFGVRWLTKRIWRWYFRAIGGVGVLLSLFLATILPSDYLDSLRLDDGHVAGRFGLWWRPTYYDVRFAELQQIQFHVMRPEHYKGPAPSYWIDLDYRDGRRKSLPMGDLLKAASHEIRSRAQAAGVNVGELPVGL